MPVEDGPDDTLDPSESLDSDEVRNDDGDTVVDPPDGWSGADRIGTTAREQRDGETLDQRLAEEEPDVVPATDEGDTGTGRRHRGQISGSPEDGDSIFPLVD
ncbi:hypothetical protein [Rhodococcus gannanensis]|uniref:DUF5709 domain-containing protein n=1 Tax=Rhodococcus gannanensis TaxID=1960308 RepID=A0ABW4P6M1_9NOCA